MSSSNISHVTVAIFHAYNMLFHRQRLQPSIIGTTCPTCLSGVTYKKSIRETKTKQNKIKNKSTSCTLTNVYHIFFPDDISLLSSENEERRINVINHIGDVE